MSIEIAPALRGVPAPQLHAPAAAELIPNAPGRWRVVVAGRIAGHLETRTESRGTRFVARRYRAEAGGFVDVGAFWNADDAVAALRG